MDAHEAESLRAASPAHVAVMVAEVVGLVRACKPRVVVDATVGGGGHAEAILEATDAHLIGLDRDCEVLKIAAKRLERFGTRVSLTRSNFADLATILDRRETATVGVVFADLGMSSFALDNPRRGFSFAAEGPLDMRMDDRQTLRAYDLVNEENENELARLIQTYGEERHARRIARALIEARRRRPLETTGELRAAIEGALGGRRAGGINPATRTFQALRMAVNDETASLAALLEVAPARLLPGGRMIVIAYHSLEDRPVKRRFRELAASGFSVITRRALRPEASEIARNRRARSARLRCLEKSTS
jgi:16S rRNA (cytosine1402-N4)-methyltransferase